MWEKKWMEDDERKSEIKRAREKVEEREWEKKKKGSEY